MFFICYFCRHLLTAMQKCTRSTRGRGDRGYTLILNTCSENHKAFQRSFKSSCIAEIQIINLAMFFKPRTFMSLLPIPDYTDSALLTAVWVTKLAHSVHPRAQVTPQASQLSGCIRRSWTVIIIRADLVWAETWAWILFSAAWKKARHTCSTPPHHTN